MVSHLRSIVSSINPKLALQTSMHFFACIGFFSLVAFILTAHYYAIALALPTILFGWFILYKIEEGVRIRLSGKEVGWQRKATA